MVCRGAAIGLVLALTGCASDGTPTADASDRALTPVNLGAFFDCLRTNQTAIVSAHRGGYREGYPENAIETFAETLAKSPVPVLLETDVRQTADGVLVLLHDDTLERTTTGEGELAERTLASLADVRLTDENGVETAFSIPTLDAALAWSKGRTVLQLDVKRGVPFEAVVDAVRRANAQERVIVITYSPADAVTVHRLAPELMISASIESAADLAGLRAGGVDASRILAWTGTRTPAPALWADLRAAGVEPMFGTLGRRGESWDDRIAKDGVDLEYSDFAGQGLTVIGTNRALAAARALSVRGGGAPAISACEARS